MQNFLIAKISNSIEKQTGSKIQIKKVSLSGLSKIQLEDVLLSDNYKDTLLYVKKLRTEIAGIYLRSSNFQLNHTELDEPYFKIVNYADSSMNLYTFLDALEKDSKQDTTKAVFASFFSISSVKIKNGRFVYFDVNSKPIDWGMNYDDLDFYNVNADVHNIRTIGDAIKMDIRSIKSREKSGFWVRNAKAKLTIDGGLLRFENFRMKTPKSILNGSLLDFSYQSNTGAWGNFTKAVLLDYKIKKSRISLEEMALFNSALRGYDQILLGEAHVTGTVQNMRVENAKITTYDNTLFKGNLSLKGLPNIDETFIEADITDFQTSLDDIEMVKIPNYEDGYLSFPESLKKLGVFAYKGKYLGFISDFVFYGQFFTDFGNLKTDISVKPTTKTKQLELSGTIISKDFEIGNLLSNNLLGKVSFNVDILNAMANEDYNSYAKLKGVVNKAEINKYPYQNISINGLFAEKVFDGKVKMKDKNIAFDFNGKVDFHEEVPKMDFNFNLGYAKLSPLNFNVLSNDKLANIAFSMHSEINGGNIDNAIGSITIKDVKYANSKGKLATDTIRLSSKIKANEHLLTLESDFIDAELKGDFKISNLSELPSRLFARHVDIGQIANIDSLENEQGELSVKLKELNPLLYLFTNGFQVSKNTELIASYSVGNKTVLNFDFNSDFFSWGSKELHKIQMKASGEEELQMDFSIDEIDISERSRILNFGIENTVRKNVMNTNVNWGDSESLSYSGKVIVETQFKKLANKKYSILNTFNPTVITFNNQKWNVNESTVRIDSTDIKIEDFKISNSDESLELNGLWSPKQTKSLNGRLDNVELEHIWNVFKPVDVNMQGKLSGYLSYQEDENNYILEADLQIPNLILGNQSLGRLSVLSDWEKSNTLCTKIELIKGNQKLLSVEGDYNGNNSELDYTAKLRKFDLSPVKYFAEPYLNKFDGDVSGTVSLKGVAEKPIINGDLLVDISDIIPSDTGVSYHLKENIKVQDNRVDFKDFKVLDNENNFATVNGTVLFESETNTSVDLKVKTQKLRVLEESYQPLAYGKAHIATYLGVTGTFEHLKVLGNIKTDDNSKIIVPFDSASEVEDNDFITFINPTDSLFSEENKEVLFIPTGATSPVSFDVDFSINPTSEIQVLFEAKSGSVLKSKGKANLLISRNQLGKQTIVGEYKVTKGSFLYSLENIVNKKFILQKGGTIRWNGAPEKAYVDLRAVYKTKTSIAPLLYREPNGEKQRQTVVLCKAHITGMLENPNLAFEIEFPNLERTKAGNVEAALQTTNITKQVLSLLVLNQFSTPEYSENVADNSNANALSVTTSELLSNQISNILSQLSDAVNIGFVYRPGDELTKEELGLAFSTELLQNRVVISGNLGFASQDNTKRFNDFAGDVNVDFKLNKKGTLLFRVFSHSRDNFYFYENNKNVQGVGLLYNEEFDSFKELWQHYKEKLGLGSKKKKK